MRHRIAGPWAGNTSDNWRTECRQRKHQFPCRLEGHALGESEDTVNLYELIDRLGEELTGNETIFTDAGQPFYILPQALRLKDGQRYLVPGSLAEMGWALPASIGIAAAAPERLAIGIVGDGSLQTNIQELQTIAHHRLNIKLFIVNNGGYASIRNTQNSFFNGYFVGSTPESGVTLPKLSQSPRPTASLMCSARTVGDNGPHPASAPNTRAGHLRGHEPGEPARDADRPFVHAARRPHAIQGAARNGPAPRHRYRTTRVGDSNLNSTAGRFLVFQERTVHGNRGRHEEQDHQGTRLQ